MTDKETLINLFDKVGIVYTNDTKLNEITVEAKTGPKNLGYMCFLSAYSFDKEGNLLSVGCWE